jgi:hypothetical protein
MPAHFVGTWFATCLLAAFQEKVRKTLQATSLRQILK